MTSIIHLEKVLLVFTLLLCTAYGVFYYRNNEPDYPRIGKRTRMTTDDKYLPQGVDPQLMLTADQSLSSNQLKRGLFTQGSSGIPRVGRRDEDKRGVFTQGSSGYPRFGKREGAWNEKRGVFTQGSNGYPRYGRSSGGDVWSDGVVVNPKTEESRAEDEKGEVGQVMESGDSLRLQASALPLLFLELDSDNDGKLSKEEFVTGLQILKVQSLIC